MDPHVLHAQRKTLLAQAPSMESYSPTSSEHHAWLGRAYALVKRWNPSETFQFKFACDSLGNSALTRDGHITKIFSVLNRAAADLELRLPAVGQAFGPGAMYDFFVALNAVISSAQKSLFIIDPYIDDEVFDTYLSDVPRTVTVCILGENYSAKVFAAAQRFSQQHGVSVEARRSKAIHDRVIFIDSNECWVLGNSIRKAAESKPTYLAPLSPDISALKLSHYEDIWSKATAI